MCVSSCGGRVVFANCGAPRGGIAQFQGILSLSFSRLSTKSLDA